MLKISHRIDPSMRGNAITLQGSPISHLPTARLFAYATHFDALPLALEWVDDNTCVLVFESKTLAQAGYQQLRKQADEEPDEDAFITAKPIPVDFWPPEERINHGLGTGEGLKGIIRMRWARAEDVKKKGARQESQFYRKHGWTAGKELFNGRENQGALKKRKRIDTRSDAEFAAQLDAELDDIVNSEEVIDEPPSKMRSDYIAADGRTVLQHHSDLNPQPDTLLTRISAPPPRRAGGRGDARGRENAKSRNARGERGGNRRPHKTQEELDAELDAFLNEPTAGA
jgi:hypothetical protein